MGAFFRYFFSNVYSILAEKAPFRRKLEMLSEYVRIELKYAFLFRLLRIRMTEEKIFGFNVKFFSYASFRLLFDEIFINKIYFFAAKKTNPLIIDCGSNIGMSILFFKMMYPDSKIIAFEPDRNTFRMLETNIYANNLKNVELHNTALSNRKGPITFFYDKKNMGSPRMSAVRNNSFEGQEQVDAALLSDYIRERVDFLKMDIEGSEDLVIEELADKKKLKCISEAAFEYHNKDTLQKFLKMLKDGGLVRIRGASAKDLERNELEAIMIHAYRE